MAALTPVPKIQFFDANGHPLAGGKLYSYSAGTTTPLVTYTDQAGTSANTNPVILDARGEASVWLGTGPYKLRLTTATDVDIWTVDDIYSEGALSMQELLSSAGSSLVGFIQSGTGATYRTVQSKLRDTVSVKDFGAVGDGVADDTAAIQAALTYCKANGYAIQGAPGTYKITSTVVIECDGDMSAMTISVNAASVATAIRVGPNTAGQYLFDADIKLPFVINSAKSGAGWTGFANSIGVEVANVYQSRITVPSIYNFGVGLSCGGYGVGCVYNTFTLGVIFGNKINLQLLPKTTTGWCNQNTFIGGRLGYSSSEGTSVAGVIQIQLRHQSGATNGAPNNNVFVNPSIEGDEPQFHLDVQGSYNQWIAPRFEVGAGVPGRVNFYAETVGETSDNNLIGGYDIAGITYTYSGAGTSVRNKRIGGSSSDSFEYSGNGINYVNKSGNSRTAPHIQGFLSSQSAIAKTNSSTDWLYRLHGDGLSIKSSGDSFDRVAIDAAGYAYFGRGGATPTNFIRGGSPAGYGLIVGGGILYPDTDNTRTLGDASFRWSVVYAGTGTINTSDEREKQQIRALTAAEQRVAVALKGLVKAFKFNSAVQAKGDDARIHVGVIAQEVIAAFSAEGLDPMRYGIVCYDQWDAEGDRLAGDRYGVRYEELLAFIIASL